MEKCNFGVIVGLVLTLFTGCGNKSEKTAIDVLEDIGGRIDRELNYLGLSGTETTDHQLKYVEELAWLEWLELNGARNITDAGLVNLAGLPNLKRLNLSHTAITDVGLAHLEGMAGLEHLELEGTKITDAGLAQLGKLAGLEWLDLGQSMVTDAGLVHLERMTWLEFLIIGGPDVTEDAVRKLQAAMPNCEVVHR